MALPAKTGKDDGKKLTGVQKTAIFLLSLGEEYAAKMFGLMEDEEIKEVSQAMSNLGRVSSETVEQLMMEFSDQLSASSGIVGSHEGTEKLLSKILGKDRVDEIMEEIRGPAGRNTWEKLGNVNEEILAAYLKNEYPQTIALVLSKLASAHAARVLSVLPEDLSMEVVARMLSMEAIKKEVLQGVENTLRIEFMNNLARTQRRDSFEMMAEIFNNFDRNTESRFMLGLEERDSESAERIRALMFTFEDLIKIDPSGIQVLMRNIDKDKLGTALKGASEAIKDLFFSNMSERAAKILREDMEGMGPVRLKDVDEAQMYVVMTAKDLSAKGEIVISDGGGEEQLVY